MMRRRCALTASMPAGTTAGRHRRAAAAVLVCGSAVVLTACGLANPDTPTAVSTSAPTTGAAPTAGVDGATSDASQTTGGIPTDSATVDSVQTDASASSSALVVTSAQYSAGTHGLQVSAFVQGLVETGGTCRANAARSGGSPLTGSPVDAEAGPSTTDCVGLALPLPAGSAGTWQVWVTYASAKAHLTSAKTAVRVP
jgi:hypothetical protein